MSTLIKADQLARSLAGHDAGTVYVVLRQEGSRLLVADGRHKGIDSPKRKNPMHVQLIRHLDSELLAQMSQITGDDDVRRILKQYTSKEKTQADKKCVQEVMHVKD